MARRDGAWLLRLELAPGDWLEASTDDLTLDELEVAENVSGVPWAAMNPLRSTRVARGLLAVLLIRHNRAAGMEQQPAEEKGLDMVAQVTGAQLSDAFTWQPPTERMPTSGEDGDPPS